MEVDFDLSDLFPTGGCIHQLAHAAVSIWAGTVWSWPVGLTVYAGLYLAITVSNIAVMVATGNRRAVGINRWAWLVLAAAAILLSTPHGFPLSRG